MSSVERKSRNGEGPPQMPPHLSLGELLGAGGMGEVYAADHAEMGPVVVKLMHAHLDDRNRERLRLEAEVLGKLRSPHVVRVLDWGVAEERPFLVMERLHGHGLDQRLARGALDPMEAVKIALDVLRGLAVVHDTKLVHRDIKPANIFICPDRAVLLDFGIVKLVESVTGIAALANPTKAGAAIGTPRYMSPEQARGRAVDGRTDIYCLGAVLFRMLTGENLFPYEDFVRQVTAHVKEAPRRPSLVHPGVPTELDAVVVRALEKKPSKRFEDARAFMRALEDAIGLPRGNVDLDDSAGTLVMRPEPRPPAAATAPAAAAAPAAGMAPPAQPAPATRALTSSPNVPAPADDDGFVALEPGDRCGNYTIERELGRGGMGIVYLAKGDDGQRRAIKTLVFGGHLTEQLIERFSREMLLLSSIESAHMVRFYEAGKLERPEGTTMWIALEYLDGRTLREILADNPEGVEPESVARWCRHIADGVSAAHKLHVVHRDLKPENAALSGETVKVFDLGIAKWQLASTSTAGHMRIGTLAYMAPEQADPTVGGIDERTDVYALGLILMELATGRHPICPFDEPLSAMEVQLRIVGMEPPPLTSLVPGFPEDLSAVAARCLHKNPAARFASMREVSDALEEVLIRLRTRRHAAAFAELGVDAGAAHDAARKARSRSGSDLTPPPVVLARSGGVSSRPPMSHGGHPHSGVPSGPVSQSPHYAITPVDGHAGAHPFMQTMVAEPQQLAAIHAADASTTGMRLSVSSSATGLTPPPHLQPRRSGWRTTFAAIAIVGVLGGLGFVGWTQWLERGDGSAHTERGLASGAGSSPRASVSSASTTTPEEAKAEPAEVSPSESPTNTAGDDIAPAPIASPTPAVSASAKAGGPAPRNWGSRGTRAADPPPPEPKKPAYTGPLL